jgi:uncharacterized protein YgiM (DUF1202 family)
MMFNFKLANVSTFSNGDVALLVTLPREYQSKVDDLNKLCESDKLKTIEIKVYKEKRSLDSNAYCWTLLNKIAKKLSTTDEEVYIQMLKRYGAKDYIAAPKESEEILSRVYKIVEPVKDCMINNTKAVTYRLIRGSSSYDVTEMSQLINGVVEEAKALGIETATTEELNKLILEWGNK